MKLIVIFYMSYAHVWPCSIIPSSHGDDRQISPRAGHSRASCASRSSWTCWTSIPFRQARQWILDSGDDVFSASAPCCTLSSEVWIDCCPCLPTCAVACQGPVAPCWFRSSGAPKSKDKLGPGAIQCNSHCSSWGQGGMVYPDGATRMKEQKITLLPLSIRYWLQSIGGSFSLLILKINSGYWFCFWIFYWFYFSKKWKKLKFSIDFAGVFFSSSKSIEKCSFQCIQCCFLLKF